MTIRMLPSTDGHPGLNRCLGTDSTGLCRYQLNSQGYRSREWREYQWDQCLWLMGCSFALGIGVDQDQTLADHLERQLGRPVINLAQGGTSIRWSVDQFSLALSQGLRPWAVAVVWPDCARWPWIAQPGEAPELSQNMFLAHTASDHYMQARAQRDIAQWRVMADLLGVGRSELTWSTHTHDAMGLDYEVTDYYYPQIDLGVDQQHPGPLSHRRAAKLLAEQLTAGTRL